MNNKISLEPLVPTPPIPNAFTSAVIAVANALGIETDNKTLFEKYMENIGVSSQLDSPNDNPSNVYNLF